MPSLYDELPHLALMIDLRCAINRVPCDNHDFNRSLMDPGYYVPRQRGPYAVWPLHRPTEVADITANFVSDLCALYTPTVAGVELIVEAFKVTEWRSEAAWRALENLIAAVVADGRPTELP